MKNSERDFSSLSVKDLLEAREAYHIHLENIENVVATAIGKYMIRKSDPDAYNYFKDRNKWKQTGVKKPERTLTNTVIQPWSWPCILVFVDKWVQAKDIIAKTPDAIIPRYLYMPNGKIIPTCVVLVQENKSGVASLKNLNFPSQLIGGGYPIFSDEQGQQKVGSLGCLVTDGDSVFALTNRHITGEEGRVIKSMLKDETIEIGETAKSRAEQKSQLGKSSFEDVYYSYKGKRTIVNIDAGLIKLYDINNFTAQVFGIGEIGELINLHSDNISLDLIDRPVCAFGGVSGKLTGKIQALFYRYKTVGGIEYVSDFLIGPKDNHPVSTKPGDSGTIWFIDDPIKTDDYHAKQYRPIAMQWGGQVFNEDNDKKVIFALATALSTICRELDIEIIPDWNVGFNEYWGKTGHYKIAAKACELVKNKKLKILLDKNLDAIAFNDNAIKNGKIKEMDSKNFTPLADVPDLVWRNTKKLDSTSHFADMDEKGKGKFAGKSLLELCKKTSNIDIDIWCEFYRSIEKQPEDMGSLPFRVWQIYNNMVSSLKKKKIDEYICAGGILSHYIADACQSLHISRLHHGRAEKPEESKVHGIYETKMLDRFSVELISGINNNSIVKKNKISFKGGRNAAIKTIELMTFAMDKLPPIKIIEAYNRKKGRERLPYMWEKLKEGTFDCIAQGCIVMKSIWENTWLEGNGKSISENKIIVLDKLELKALYNRKDFLPAYRLNDPKFKEFLK